MAFSFRKEMSSVRVDDDIFSLLVAAAKNKTHGDIQSVVCLANGRFQIVSKKRGTVERGGLQLMALLRRDIESEPARREAYKASQILAKVAKTRPDLIKFAETAIEVYNEDAKKHPDILDVVTESNRATSMLQLVREAEAAEDQAREIARKGFSLRKEA